MNADISRLKLSQTGCESEREKELESEREKELVRDHVGCEAMVFVVLVVVRNALRKPL